ncbi:3-oxo-tetronate kinase [Paracoccus denitrificans]|uniref:3-oxo-tetronate kinase n=1 Tax=Paracoccus denitrificans TaxID=266 RepID=UPI003364D278
MLLGAIADDLTGATDLSLILSRAGMSVIQVVGVPDEGADFGNADAFVVALKSRTIPAAEAVEQSLASARVLRARGARQLYFKYCSTFDSTAEGNIGPVTDALLDLIGETRTVACPAFPQNGRTVYQGHLFVGSQLLSDSPMKDHPLTPMRDADLRRVLAAQTARPVDLVAHATVAQGVEAVAAALAGAEGIAITDAICNADLMTLGKALAGYGLVTGGSALALGLPQNFRAAGLLAEDAGNADFTAPKGPGIMLAGSCSAATRQQVARAEANGIATLALDPLAIASGETRIEDALAFIAAHAGDPRPPLLYSSADPEAVAQAQEKLGRAQAGVVVEAFLSGVARKLAEAGTRRFIVAGGETSGAVVEALGAMAVRIGPEIDPGVPWVVSTDPVAPMALALKSGNFGCEDFFAKAWDMLA